MREPYRRFTDPCEALRAVRDLAARTVIIDVEPLVAFWGTGQEVLTGGVSAVLAQISREPGQVRHVVFATNSARRPSAPPTAPGLQVRYVARAHKPLLLGSFKALPRPGVVIGDQVATDGLLAWRLGYSFLHYDHDLAGMPRGPRLMGALGLPLRRLLFPKG